MVSDLSAVLARLEKITKGPWPRKYTGDGKRIIVGDGLVEGPNGYEVAEVYSDDCDHETAEANGLGVSLVPELIAVARAAAELRHLQRNEYDAQAIHGIGGYERRVAEETEALDAALSALANAGGEK